MRKSLRGINPDSKPSGDGCVECLASPQGWWFHLRRCAECGHIGCCDSSPSQHASKHAATTGHPIIASFEPGEDWFFDYEEARNDQRYGVTSATRASKKSACFWTRRQGASQLGIASKLAARYRFCFRGRLLA
ncbi:MAG: UBP-type zinc finger domain-containing protein, partial [Terriglobales bacterium]